MFDLNERAAACGRARRRSVARPRRRRQREDRHARPSGRPAASRRRRPRAGVPGHVQPAGGPGAAAAGRPAVRHRRRRPGVGRHVPLRGQPGPAPPRPAPRARSRVQHPRLGRRHRAVRPDPLRSGPPPRQLAATAPQPAVARGRPTLASIYDRVVNTGERLPVVLQRWFPWCGGEAEGIKAAFEAYVVRKREHQLLDYDDLLLCWRALGAVPGLLPSLFDHVLVDEYQDTNTLQADILAALRPDGRGAHGRGRRRPGHLRLPGRQQRQPARLPRAVPRRHRGAARAELPLHPAHRGRGQRGHGRVGSRNGHDQGAVVRPGGQPSAPAADVWRRGGRGCRRVRLRPGPP